MKKLDNQTIGGRIRACRQKRGMKMNELAARAEVSDTYINMIELGTKTPSNALLTRIADILNTSFAWLKNGSEPQGDLPAQPTGAPDLQMFLLLLKRQKPELFPDTVKTIMNISSDTLDKLLSGSAEYEPQWRHALCLLAQRMDRDAAHKLLRDLDAFLDEADSSDALRSVHAALRHHLDGNGGSAYRLVGEQLYAERYAPYDDIRLEMHTLTFAKDGKCLWHFKCVDADALPDEDECGGDELERLDREQAIGDAVRDIIHEQLRCMEQNPSAQVSLVFRNVRWYERFTKCADDFQFEAEESGQLRTDMENPSFVLLDENCKKVDDWRSLYYEY